jgi:hypothetical protein
VKHASILAAMAIVGATTPRGPHIVGGGGSGLRRFRGNGSRFTFALGDREAERLRWRKHGLLRGGR